DRLLTGGKGGKRVLRAAVANLLPAEILTRKKVGFRVPVGDWFRGRLSDHLRDHLLGADSRSKRLFRPGAVETYVDEHLAGRRNHEKMLWTLLNIELFMREYRAEA